MTTILRTLRRRFGAPRTGDKAQPMPRDLAMAALGVPAPEFV